MCPAERGDHTLYISKLVYVTIIVNTSEILKLKLLKMKIINSISLFSLDLSMLSRAL